MNAQPIFRPPAMKFWFSALILAGLFGICLQLKKPDEVQSLDQANETFKKQVTGKSLTRDAPIPRQSKAFTNNPDELSEINISEFQRRFWARELSFSNWTSMWAVWAKQDPKAALSHLGSIYKNLDNPTEGLDPFKIDGVLAAVSEDALLSILKDARIEIPNETLQTLLSRLVKKAAEGSPAEALALIQEFPALNNYDLLANSIAELIRRTESPADTARNLFENGVDPELITAATAEMLSFESLDKASKKALFENLAENGVTDAQCSQLILAYGKACDAAVFEWTNQKELGPKSLEACATAMMNWAGRDLQSSGQWLNLNRANRYLDWAIAGYVSAGKTVERDAAESWFNLITNNDARSFALKHASYR